MLCRRIHSILQVADTDNCVKVNYLEDVSYLFFWAHSYSHILFFQIFFLFLSLKFPHFLMLPTSSVINWQSLKLNSWQHVILKSIQNWHILSSLFKGRMFLPFWLSLSSLCPVILWSFYLLQYPLYVTVKPKLFLVHRTSFLHLCSSFTVRIVPILQGLIQVTPPPCGFPPQQFNYNYITFWLINSPLPPGICPLW